MDLATKLCPWLHPSLQTLERQFATGRLGHAWIICGPRGVGKLNLALAFASRILNRDTESAMPPAFDPADVLAAIRDRYVPSNRHPDLHILWPEEDKKTISVEQVRAITDEIGLTAHQQAGKVTVIEPAEEMTIAAANALLKSLEEPPSDTYWLLVAHQVGRLPITVRSRCQTLTIPRPTDAEIGSWLGLEQAALETTLGAAPRLGPLLLADRITGDLINKYNQLSDILNNIHGNFLGLPAAVDRVGELGLDEALDWLIDRTQRAIRARLTAGVRNRVTDADSHLTENLWNTVALPELFEVLRQADTLRDRLGSGINESLALQSVLMHFVSSEQSRLAP